jgi:hypothetical protein
MYAYEWWSVHALRCVFLMDLILGSVYVWMSESMLRYYHLDIVVLCQVSLIENVRN